MRKENVFLVTARPLQSAGAGSKPHGQLQQFVICATDELQLHSFVNSALPQSAVIGVASLSALEETVGQIKSALARAAGSLPVYVDPAMSRKQ